MIYKLNFLNTPGVFISVPLISHSVSERRPHCLWSITPSLINISFDFDSGVCLNSVLCSIKNPFSTNAEFESLPPPPGKGVDLPCPASKDYFITFFFFCNKLLTGLLTSLNFYSLFFHRAASDLNPKSDHIKSLIKNLPRGSYLTQNKSPNPCYSLHGLKTSVP